MTRRTGEPVDVPIATAPITMPVITAATRYALEVRTGLCPCCDKLAELYQGSCLDCWDRSDDD